jgi:hypothetical protein
VATWADIRGAALVLPGVRESDMMGRPCFKVEKKGFVHTWDGRVFMKLEPARQELLFEARPDVFSPFIVGAMRWSWVEIEALDAEELAELVQEAWRQVVPKKTSREYAAA